jgi:O-antigen/teichoic acid export membrane protein
MALTRRQKEVLDCYLKRGHNQSRSVDVARRNILQTQFLAQVRYRHVLHQTPPQDGDLFLCCVMLPLLPSRALSVILTVETLSPFPAEAGHNVKGSKLDPACGKNILEMMRFTSTSSLPRSASYLMLAKTIGFAFTIVLPLLLVRRLSLNEFGNYKQFFVILQSAANLLPMGMHMSTYYFLPRAANSNEKGQIVFSVLIYYLAVSLLTGLAICIFPTIIWSLIRNPDLTRFGRLVAIALPMYVISTLFETVTLADGESRMSALIIVGSNILRTCAIVLVTLIWGTIQSIVLATMIYSCLHVTLFLFYLRDRFGRFWENFKWPLLRSHVSYALPLGVGGLLWSLQMDVHNYFVSHYFGAAVFAIYSTGCFQLPLVGILSDSVASVLIPRISALQHQSQTDRIAVLMPAVMRALAILYVPIYVFLTLMAREFVTLLFTTRYLASIPIFRINLLLLPLSLVMLDPIIRAYTEQRYWALWLNLFLLSGEVALLTILVPSLGAVAAIWIVVGIQYLNRFVTLWRLSRKVMNTSPFRLVPMKDLAKVVVAATSAGALVMILRILIIGYPPIIPLAVCGLVFSAAYVMMLLLLRLPTKQEVVAVRGKAVILARQTIGVVLHKRPR